MAPTIALLLLAGALSCAGPLTPLPLAGGEPAPGELASDPAAPSAAPPLAPEPPARAPEPPARPPEPPRLAPVSATIPLRHAPFRERTEAFVHAPGSLAGLDAVPIVVFFHGWYGCLDVVVGAEDGPCRPGEPTRPAMDLTRQFDRAGVGALLVVPQLAFDRPSSEPGALAEPGFFRSMLEEILASPELASVLPDQKRIGRVILVSHSGSYLALGRALGRGSVDVHEVWMLDALYQPVPELRTWYRSHTPDFLDHQTRRLVFLYTTAERTGPRTRALLHRLAPDHEGAGLFLGESPGLVDDKLLASPLVGQQTALAHERIPPAAFAALLRTARLPPVR
jgi:hypothetical protein